MTGLIDEIRSWPFFWAYVTLFAVVVVRAGGTYVIGRAIAAGTLRKRRADRENFQRAKAQIERWGPIAVMLSFLTVGAQTAINAAAGLLQMSWPRYLLGLIPGSLAWALIWSTIGMGAFYAVLHASETRDGTKLVVGAVAIVILGLIVLAARNGKSPED